MRRTRLPLTRLVRTTRFRFSYSDFVIVREAVILETWASRTVREVIKGVGSVKEPELEQSFIETQQDPMVLELDVKSVTRFIGEKIERNMTEDDTAPRERTLSICWGESVEGAALMILELYR